MLPGFLLLSAIVNTMAIARRNINHGYTSGSGMWKNSDNNLEKDKHLDPADYNYYDDKGIMK